MPDTITVQSAKTGKKYEITLQNPYSAADDQMIDQEVARLDGLNAPTGYYGQQNQAGRLSPTQIAQAAKSAGFTGDSLRKAVAIAMAESGGNPTAANRKAPDDSHGLWQVNYIGKLMADRTKKFGPPEAQYNPEINARSAYQISGGGKNFGPWTTYTSGAYKRFLADADAAVRNVEPPPQAAGAMAGAGRPISQREFVKKTEQKGMIADTVRGIMAAAQDTQDPELIAAVSRIAGVTGAAVGGPIADNPLLTQDLGVNRGAAFGRRVGNAKKRTPAPEPLETLMEPAPGPDLGDVLGRASGAVTDLGRTVGGLVGKTNPILYPVDAAIAAGTGKPSSIGEQVGRGAGTLTAGLLDLPGMALMAKNLGEDPKKAATDLWNLASQTWSPDASIEDRIVGIGTIALTALGIKHGASKFKEFAKTRNAAKLQADLKELGLTPVQIDGTIRATLKATTAKAISTETPGGISDLTKRRVPNAGQVKETATANGDLQPQPVQGEGQVPTRGRSRRVQPKAQGGLQQEETKGVTTLGQFEGATRVRLGDGREGVVSAIGTGKNPRVTVKFDDGTSKRLSLSTPAERVEINAGQPSKPVAKTGQTEPKPAPAKGVAPKPVKTIVSEPQVTSENTKPARKTVSKGRRGGKQSGAVDLGPLVDVAVKVGQTIKAAPKAAGRFASEATSGSVGNLYNKLNQLGEAGKEIGSSLEKVQLETGSQSARLFNSIKDEAGKHFGKAAGLVLDTKALNKIPGKVRNGEQLTPQESAVWAKWVKSVDELGKSGVPVRRLPSTDTFPELVGERADFMLPNGRMESGKIVSVEDGKVTIAVPSKVRGKRAVLHEVLNDNPFWTRQMVDPGTFWPKRLKPEIAKALRDPESKTRQTALQHLVDTGQASDLTSASKALDSEFAAQSKMGIGGSVRLENPRSGLRLKDSWYDDDFLKITEQHITESARRVAIAKHFGLRGERLERLLTQGNVIGPDGKLIKRAISEGDASVVRDEIERVLNLAPRLSSERAGAKLAAAEGGFTALRLLSAPGTAVVQLAQSASGASILGFKNTAKGLVGIGKEYAKAIATKEGSKFLKDLRDSAVIEQDMHAMLGVDDGPFKHITNIVLSPMKQTDRILRVLFAKTGLIRAEEAIKTATTNPASYRYLKEWAKFSDEDIAQMRANGMNKEQRVQAMAAGVATQVRTRLSDLPKFADSPFGKFAMRLQTYSYGQTQIVGHLAREAAHGNAAPLLKLLTVAAPVAGAGTALLKATISSLVGDDTAMEDIKARIDRAKAAYKGGKLGDMIESGTDIWWSSILESGALGMLEKGPKIKYVADKYYGGSPNALGRVAAQQFVPPTAGLAIDIMVNLYEESDSEESFIEKLKNAGVAVSRKDVPLIKMIVGPERQGRYKKAKAPSGMNLPSTSGTKMPLPPMP